MLRGSSGAVPSSSQAAAGPSSSRTACETISDVVDAIITGITVLPFVSQPTGFPDAGLNPHRPLDEEYCPFLGLLAGQMASALAGARAYETERERATALAEAVRMRQEAAETLRRANRTLAEEVERRTEESARLRDLFRQAPGFIAVLREPAHIFELTNDSYMQLVGHPGLKTLRGVVSSVRKCKAVLC